MVAAACAGSGLASAPPAAASASARPIRVATGAIRNTRSTIATTTDPSLRRAIGRLGDGSALVCDRFDRCQQAFYVRRLRVVDGACPDCSVLAQTEETVQLPCVVVAVPDGYLLVC